MVSGDEMPESGAPRQGRARALLKCTIPHFSGIKPHDSTAFLLYN